MFTKNEKRVLRYLWVNKRKTSINQIAKDLGLSPNGAHKILKKVENEDIIEKEKIANVVSYRLKEDNKAKKALELALLEKAEGKIRYRYNDLKPLEPITKAVVIFGSYLSGKNPHDLDLVVVLEKKNYRKYKDMLAKIKEIIPLPVHDVIQTKEDLLANLQEDNKAITAALQEGFILWGHDILIGVLHER